MIYEPEWYENKEFKKEATIGSTLDSLNKKIQNMEYEIKALKRIRREFINEFIGKEEEK